MLYKIIYDKGYYTAYEFGDAIEKYKQLDGNLMLSKTLNIYPEYEVICETFKPSNYMYFIFKVRRKNKRRKYL